MTTYILRIYDHLYLLLIMEVSLTQKRNVKKLKNFKEKKHSFTDNMTACILHDHKVLSLSFHPSTCHHSSPSHTRRPPFMSFSSFCEFLRLIILIESRSYPLMPFDFSSFARFAPMQSFPKPCFSLDFKNFSPFLTFQCHFLDCVCHLD